MTSEAENTSADDFFSLAERLGYATAAELAAISEECQKTSAAPETVALRRGVLDAIEIEILGTLLHPHDSIPGYEILNVLGRGGMGVVFQARQQNLDRLVALKTVLISRMGSTSALSRFEQEARMVAQLRHPNIVGGYDFGRHNGRVFFAMELVEGEELAARVKRTQVLDERLAWGIARQTAAGLSHAANHGVVHRDIKPGNLLLVEPPEGVPFPPDMPMVKIADFGLAILTDAEDASTRLTSDNTTVGSPHYMAPEQFQHSDVDLRADIYALGATVYHLLSGKPPFDGSNLTQIMAGKLAGRYAPLEERRPGLSPGTYKLLDRMMAQSPDHRPSNYQELISEIDSLCPDLFSGTSSVPAFAPTAELVTPQRIVKKSKDTARLTDSQTESAILPGDIAQETSSGQNARVSRRAFVIGTTIAVSGLLAGAAWFASLQDGNSSSVSPERLKMSEAGPAVRIFNGSNISGWQQRSGNWIVPPRSATLHGTNGLLVRPLFQEVDGKPRPLEFYRLIVFLDRAAAESVEIQFGFAVDQRRNGPRYVLRLSGDGFSIGERSADDAEFIPSGGKPPLATTGETAAIIERQPGGWFVSINEKPLAALPRRSGGELPEVRLAVKGGPGEFSEVTVTELTAADQ